MTYDIVIIGGGPGGCAAAREGARHGKKIALIEYENTEKLKVGGTCLHSGCIPTKAFYAATTKNLSFSEARSQAQKTIETLHNDLFDSLSGQKNITLINGRAHITSDAHVKVNNETLETKSIIIATGSRPFIPEAYTKAHDKIKVLTNESVFTLNEVPKRLAIIGGGYIGCEWAHIFAHYGSTVTIVESQGDILLSEDKDVSREVKRAYTHRGITILTEMKSINYDEYDAVLIATGRSANIEDLGLDECGVVHTQYGIVVDEHMMSTVKGIYAVGDCIDKDYRLAHVAEHEGIIAARHALGIEARMSYHSIPSTLFTSPQIMRVGKREKDFPAEAYIMGRSWLKANGRALCEDNSVGFVKILADAKGTILGAASVGNCDLHEVVVAMTAGMNIQEFAEIIRFHPSTNEAIRDAARKVVE